MSSISFLGQFQRINARAALAVGLAVALIAVYCPAARADFSTTFSTVSGDKSASAVFTLTGNLLTIQVTNTSTPTGTAPTTGGGQILTELMFNSTGSGSELSPDITNGSGATASGILGALPSGVTSIGANWALEATTTGFSVPAENTVISTTGVDDNGNPNTGYFADVIQRPLDGPNFGIAANSYGPALANGFSVLAQDSITFNLTASSSFSLSELGSAVTFVFGTGGAETSLITGTPTPGPSPVPEPTSLTMWSLMGLAAVVYARRKKRAAP